MTTSMRKTPEPKKTSWLLSEPNRMRLLGQTLLLVLQVLCYSACIVAFLATSINTLVQYTAKKTTIAINYESRPDGIEFPSLTFCNKSGFTNKGPNHLMKDYLSNVVSYDDLFAADVVIEDPTAQPISPPRQLLTMYKGRCFTFSTKGLIRQMTTVVHFPSMNVSELVIFAHEPGEEFWLHYDFFPNKIPNFFMLKNDIASMDVSLTKTITKSHDKCREWPQWQQVAPCEVARFDIYMQYYDHYSGIVHLQQYGRTDQKRILYFFYPKNEVVYKEVNLLMTFTDFIAASGGNLGLFLGLSCVSVLMQIIQLVEKRFLNKTNTVRAKK